MAEQPESPAPLAGCANWWVCFLASFATHGGGLVLVFVLILVFLPVTVYVMVHYGPGAPVVITITTLLGSLVGALLQGCSNQKKADGAGHP